MMKYFVAYYRVSTKHQGKDGNGIKAQRTSVRAFLNARDAELIDQFTEIESRRNNNRPVLTEAINLCKMEEADLLIAKLDRLSGEVEFIFQLKRELEEAGIGFVFADYPDAANNTLMLANLAGFAQHEAEVISKRTKQAIAQSDVYKSGNWGNPQNLTDDARAKAHQTISRKARQNKANRIAFEFIRNRRQDMSYAEIADALNEDGYRTRTGKQFHPATVRRIYLRFTSHK